MNDRKIPLRVDPYAPLRDVQESLEVESGTPTSNQRLFFQNHELVRKDRPVRTHRIESGAVLNMEPARVPVRLKTPDGKVSDLRLTPDDDADAIKAAVERGTGLDAAKISVRFEGKELPPRNRTVREMGLYERDDRPRLLEVEHLKMTVTVRWRKDSVRVPVDPAETTGAFRKRLLNEETNLVTDASERTKRHDLFLKDVGLVDDDVTLAEAGVRTGSVLDLEPEFLEFRVVTPDKVARTVELKPRRNVAALKEAVAAVSGYAARRQILTTDGGKRTFSDDAAAVKDLYLPDDGVLVVELVKIPVTVKEKHGGVLELRVEPSADVSEVKRGVHGEWPDWEVQRQILRHNDEELADGTVEECGIGARAILWVDLMTDNIIFVDIKCGTLFAVDRNSVLEKGILTLVAPEEEKQKDEEKENNDEKEKQKENNDEKEIREENSDETEKQAENSDEKEKQGEEEQVDKTENEEKEKPTKDVKVFKEAVLQSDVEGRQKLLKIMKDSPTLGVATQKVVTSTQISEIKLAEAEKVSQIWGVELKSYKRNKKGEEFIFVDPKTGSTGELIRQKYVDMKFITPVPASGKDPETIAEREKDTMAYEDYIKDIRSVFGVKSHADNVEK